MWCVFLTLGFAVWAESNKGAGLTLSTTLRKLVPQKKEPTPDTPSYKSSNLPSKLAFLKDKTPEPRRSYMDALLLTRGSPHKWNEVMDSIEDHASLPPRTNSFWKKLRLRPTFCSNEDINRLYESLLTKEILLSAALSKKMQPVMKGVMQGLHTLVGEEPMKRSLKAWALDERADKHFGISNLEKKDKERNVLEGEEMSLTLDFLTFQAKKLEGVGLPDSLTQIRDTFFKGVIEQRRGFRSNQETDAKNKQWGILQQSLPALESNMPSPWTHWGKDKCQIYEGQTPYLKEARSRDIPIVCGISGTTHLILWSVLASHSKLSPEEWRLFLVSIWGVLGADGGHALQEILSAAKLNATVVLRQGKMIPGWSPYWTESLESLAKALESISAEGLPPKKGAHTEHFGRYHTDFFSHIKEPAFLEIRTKARKALQNLLQDPATCETLDPRLKETQS